MINRGELDCLKHRLRILSTFWYEADGSIISSSTNHTIPFVEVKPESPGDWLLKALCKKD